MKNTALNSIIQTAMFTESNEINIKDKKEMRQRLLSTQLVNPGNIEIKVWLPEDQNETITYEYATSLFGNILAASTSKGLCYVGFDKNSRISAIDDLKRRFPENFLIKDTSPFQQTAIKLMNDPQSLLPLQLHLKSTKFQLEIWKKLSQIPKGGLITYGEIGGSNKYARATGTAVGSNPISYLLPCHRVINSDGGYKGYFWGPELKEKILKWETKEALLPHTESQN